jgi:type VI secretion system protein ImpB
MAGKEGTVAPRERVNIVYKSATGDAVEEVELPLRLVMLGDYTLRQDSTPLEDRKPIDINKDNFNDVLRSQNINLTVQVPNKLAEKEGEEMPATLKFSHIKDFEPELKKLLELRQALNALKGPLGNLPEFRKKIQTIIGDKAAREKLAAEIGGGKKE